MTLTASNKYIVPLVVSLALFMDSLDTTIINTAIPAMSRSLQVNPVDLKIALISYLLSLAIFIPISGWIADKFGIKRVFITAVSIFTLSSLWCGYAHTLFELVIARSTQGVGGALMLPLGRLILLRTFPRHQYIEAMNAVIMVVSVGLMLGPFAGGMITDHLSWPWIFWVNIPVGMLAIGVASWKLKESAPQKVPPLDLFGFILFGGGIAGLTFALSDFSESTASQQTALNVLLVSVLMLVGYFWYSKTKRHPIIKTKLFRIRTFQVSILGNLFGRLGLGGAPFLLPLILQIGLGYSAQLSGTLVAPIALGILLVKVKSFSTRVLRLFGYKRLLLINTFLVGFSLWLFIFINPAISIYVIACLTFLFGFLISMQYTAVNSLAYAEVETEDLSAATSVVSMIQQLSQSFGVAVSALLLRYYSANHSQQFLLTLTTFHKTFFTMGILTFLSVVIYMRLKPNDGQQLLTIKAQEKVSAG